MLEGVYGWNELYRAKLSSGERSMEEGIKTSFSMFTHKALLDYK